MGEEKVAHLVVDSGGFIRNAPIGDIGTVIYTIPEVVHEIRDKATRQRLQVLPYELKFRQPSAESIRDVTEFSKKTGDYRSLSAVDIRVMALAYQLEKEHVGSEHIKLEPNKEVTWNTTKKHLEKPTEIAGFYLSKKQNNVGESVEETNVPDEIIDKLKEARISTSERTPENESPAESSEKTEPQLESEEGPDDTNSDKYVADSISADQLLEGDSSEEEEEDEEDDDDCDDDGWITPSNIKQVKASMGEVGVEKASVDVGCITLDFAMQNVLLQMGLNVVSVDGMLIKKAKSYVLWCATCFKTTLDMTKDFCYKCGHKNLKKVSMSINEDGSIQYHLSRRKPVSCRGLRYSLPTPKGGKYANNPILCADQKEAQQRMATKSKVKYDVFDPDFVVHASPFAPVDVHSKSAQLGIRDHKHAFRNKRNPNENNKVYGRRK